MKIRSSQAQLVIPGFSFEKDGDGIKTNRQKNQLEPEDRRFHDWYRFVLSFPPHLVRKYIKEFELGRGHKVLDPFCGTGTTLVESKLNGIHGIGIEANPFAHFTSSIKTDWSIDPDLFQERARKIGKSALNLLRSQGIDDYRCMSNIAEATSLKTLPPEATKLLLKNSISPIPLHKILILLNCLKEYYHEPYYNHMQLALAKALVFFISNLHFGPEVGVRKIKEDSPVIAPWLSEVDKIAKDIRTVSGKAFPESKVSLADARQIGQIIEPDSIDAVITSPPYPNEKDYTRTTRLESVILGFITDKKALRKFKKTLIRSNTRNVYKGDYDDDWIADFPNIQRIADEIERRRIELGKTSGFERMYGNVTRLYFGGMARHFTELQTVLRPGAKLAYVVGDQASYFRVLIRTGQLLAEIAKSLGYEIINIDLFRTRFATASKSELREEVVILRWPGAKKE